MTGYLSALNFILLSRKINFNFNTLILQYKTLESTISQWNNKICRILQRWYVKGVPDHARSVVFRLTQDNANKTSAVMKCSKMTAYMASKHLSSTIYIKKLTVLVNALLKLMIGYQLRRLLQRSNH